MNSNSVPRLSAIPTTRRAWRVHSRGHPTKVLKLETIPLPSASAARDEVIVKVYAASLNPVGYKLMAWLPNFIAKERPGIAEYEFSGTVLGSNGEKSGFKEGDRVVGYTLPEHGSSEGALTTHIVVPTSQIFHHPSANPPVTHEEISGMFVTPLSAYFALFRIAQLSPHIVENKDERKAIFINGGSTSVGRMAIMMAKNCLGYKVDVSCSPSNVESMKTLGADEVYDYTASPLHEQLLDSFSASPAKGKYSLIFDAYGTSSSALYINSASYTLPKSQYIHAGPQGPWMSMFRFLIRGFFLPAWMGGVPRKFGILAIKPERGAIEEIMRLIEDGTLKLQVDSVFKFEDVLAAYERIMSRKTKGKVVVRVVPPDT